MLLAIDIGNSSVNMGLFSGMEIISRLRIDTSPADAASCRSRIADLVSESGSGNPLEGIIISSVVPELTGVLSDSLRGLSLRDPMIVDISTKTGISLDVEIPSEVGTDRIVNAVAAGEIFGQPALVTDFGTATTLSAIKDNTFIGGAILPGIGLMQQALSKGTAKLPEVNIAPELAGAWPLPPVLGKNTNKCIISGIIHGTAGAVEGLIAGIEKEQRCVFSVVLTGGYSGIMARFLKKEYIIEPDLTLKGMRIIYKRNT